MVSQPVHRLQHDGSLVLISASVLLVGLFYILTYTFQTPYPGLTYNFTNIGWIVISIDPCDIHPGWCQAQSPQNSLRVGDHLTAIGDLTYEDFRGNRLRVPFENHRPGESVPIILIRDGRERSVTWTMPALTLADWLTRLSALLFFGPFWLAGTGVLLFLRPRDVRWRLLIAFNYLMAIWLVVGIISSWQVAASSLVLHAVTWLLLPVYLHLHLVVPTPLFERYARYGLPPLYGVAALLAALELFQLLPRSLYFLGLLLAVAGSLGLLVFRLFDKSSPAARLATRLMLAGVGLAFVPGLGLWLIPALLMTPVPGDWATNFAILALPALPLFYVYAIYKRHLGVLEFRANRLLGLYGFILLYVTVFLIVFGATNQWVTSSEILLLGLSVAFIIPAPALSLRFQRLVDRLAYGAVYNPNELIHLFANRIPTAPNREALVRLLADEVTPSLLIRQSALYLLAEAEAHLVYARNLRLNEASRTRAQVQHLLAEAGRYRPVPMETQAVGPILVKARAEVESADSSNGNQAFDWVRLAIPLITQQRTIGVWLFGRRDPDDYYPQNDIALLSTLAQQVALAVENARLFDEAGRRLERLQARRSVDIAIIASLDLRVTLSALLEQVTTRLGVDAADILLLNTGAQTFTYAAGRGFRTRALQHTHLRLGEGHAGLAALERRIVDIPDLTQAAGELVRSPRLAGEGFITYYGVPLIAKGQIKGVLEIFHRSPLAPDPEWVEFLEALAGQAAIAIDNATLFEELQRSNLDLALAYDTTLEGWSHALELRDQETEGHTQRVTEMTLRLAQAMGLSDAELVHIRRGALLHDIGKMGVPDNILLKPGSLTDEEWIVMRKHPAYAHDMLAPIAYLRPALDIPYCHHEKWDGSGYPRELKDEQIPLAARLFAVVDVWDALRSDRPYRAKWPEAKVRDYLREQTGKHFDPTVVEVFLKILMDG